MPRELTSRGASLWPSKDWRLLSPSSNLQDEHSTGPACLTSAGIQGGKGVHRREESCLGNPSVKALGLCHSPTQNSVGSVLSQRNRSLARDHTAGE